MTDIPTPALSEFKLYRRVGEIEARPWTAEDEYRFVRGDTGRISISPADRETGKVHGLHGGYIARNPANHADQWYIAPDYFAKQYAESTHSPALREAATSKTLARLSLSIMQKACSAPEHMPAELLPDRISIGLPELDAAIELAIGAHCTFYDALVKRVAALEALTDWKHTDDVSVNRFCVAMIEKLAKKRDEGRSGWDDPQKCTLDMLAEMLVSHVPKGDPVDIANFCMMVWTRGETDEDHAPAVEAIRTATSSALREAAKERAEVIRECWEAINKYIKPGPLQGNGCDETAQRNGMILASNLLMEMLVGARADGEKP